MPSASITLFPDTSTPLRLVELPCTNGYKLSLTATLSLSLFQNYLAAIVSQSHPLAKQDSVSIIELSRYSFALPTKGLQARNALERIRERHPFDLKIRIELNDPNILLELVKQSNMVTILAEASVRNSTDVKAVKLDIPDNEMDGCVHTLANSYHKRSMKEFVRILSESIAVKVRANAWL
nr:LysR family transcriptional regulator substrate-binding protein [Bacteroides sp.]